MLEFSENGSVISPPRACRDWKWVLLSSSMGHGSERRRRRALFVEMKITSRPTITARFVSPRVKKSMSAEGKSPQNDFNSANLSPKSQHCSEALGKQMTTFAHLHKSPESSTRCVHALVEHGPDVVKGHHSRVTPPCLRAL